MSNYLQSKWLYSITYITLLFNQTALAGPINHQELPTQQKQEYQAEPTKQPWESEQNYSDKLLKNLSAEKFGDNMKESTEQVSSLKDKFVRGIGGLIYDPVHPEQLLDKLIAGYDFYLFLHKELICYGENILGSQNQMIIEAKQNYKTHIEYLTALRKQKQMIEQRMLHK